MNYNRNQAKVLKMSLKCIHKQLDSGEALAVVKTLLNSLYLCSPISLQRRLRNIFLRSWLRYLSLYAFKISFSSTVQKLLFSPHVLLTSAVRGKQRQIRWWIYKTRCKASCCIIFNSADLYLHRYLWSCKLWKRTCSQRKS